MTRTLTRAALSLGCLMVAAGSRAQEPPRRHAVVIGLDRAEANIEGVSRLVYAEKDAEAVVAALKAQRFENVVPLIGPLARRETIVSALAKLVQEANPQDTVLVYFAGHGVKAKWAERGGKPHSYWLSYDATLASLEVKGLRLEHVMDYVDDIPAARKVVILDHCHSGSVELPKAVAGGGGGGGRQATGSLKIKRDLFLPTEFQSQVVSRVGEEGLLILGSATETAYELANLQNGLFTHVLLQAIGSNVADAPPAGNNDGKLSADELVKYVNAKVGPLATTNNVNQQPIYLTRGNVLGWDLMTLPQDTSKEVNDLLGVVGGLAGNGLDRRVVEICRVAINAWAGARRNGVPPTERDNRIVTYLKELQARETGIDWRSEAPILAGFIRTLDQ